MLPHHVVSEYLSWALDTDAEVQSVSSLAGGVHDNYLVQGHVNETTCRFVVRRMPPPGAAGFARSEVMIYSLQAEFNVLQSLENAALRTPKVCGFDYEGKFLGTPSFLMEYIEGPTVLDAIAFDPSMVLQKFADTIFGMNQISPAEVPGVTAPAGAAKEQPARGLLDWLIVQTQTIDVPTVFKGGLEMLTEEFPAHTPQSAFGNGDLNPQNFIYMADGSIAVVDWEYAGFNDPLAELMLLHSWPEQRPFLNTYPLDSLYCEIAGLDPKLLCWYEVYGALNGWVFAARDHRFDALALYEQQASALLQ
jgi:aminoglycoside phosphotransferase (APT) family kinase protein